MFKFIKQHYEADPSTYVGLPGELTIADDGTNFSVHDGSTPGGSLIDAMSDGNIDLVASDLLGGGGAITMATGNAIGYGNGGDFALNAGGGYSGGSLYFTAGGGSGPGAGGVVYITAGTGGLSGGDGGDVTVQSGSGTGNSGDVTLRTGTATGTRGYIYLDAPRVIMAYTPTANILGATGVDAADGVSVGISGGNSDGTGGAGFVGISGGSVLADGNFNQGGSVYITGGSASFGEGGDIWITPGDGSPGGRLFIPLLPTSDPHVANAVWNSSGTLMISAGP